CTSINIHTTPVHYTLPPTRRSSDLAERNGAWGEHRPAGPRLVQVGGDDGFAGAETLLAGPIFVMLREILQDLGALGRGGHVLQFSVSLLEDDRRGLRLGYRACVLV